MRLEVERLQVLLKVERTTAKPISEYKSLKQFLALSGGDASLRLSDEITDDCSVALPKI